MNIKFAGCILVLSGLCQAVIGGGMLTGSTWMVGVGVLMSALISLMYGTSLIQYQGNKEYWSRFDRRVANR